MWTTEIQAEIYTTAKVRAERILRPVYPDIRFTQDDSAQLEPKFPTVYIHYLQGMETARDTDGDTVNAFSSDVQIDVTVSKAQGKTVAEKVMDEIVTQYKALRYGLRGMPVIVPTGNDTKQISARMNRLIGVDDTL